MTSRWRTLSLGTGLGLFIALGCFVGDDVALEAQNRKNFSIVNEESGHVALGLAMRKLGVAGTFMNCPAHPDDERNELLTLAGYGMGLRSIDVQNNRGEGGQNEIGPELFRDIGVLRTSELLAAHQIDGAEQYFTRAIDYGYSWDPNEVIQKWGRDEIIGDYVRLFRTLRPDVIVTMNIQGGGGDRAHEATTVLVREAFRAAGDPTRYPDQLQSGLRPWQASKLYFAGGGPGGGRGGRGAPAPATAVHTDRIDAAVLRSAARADICRDRRGRAEQPQVPGNRNRPAALARPGRRRERRPGRGSGRRRLHTGRHDNPGRDGKARGQSLRRRRSQSGRPRAIRRGESARRADQRIGGHRRSRAARDGKPSMRATMPARSRRLRQG